MRLDWNCEDFSLPSDSFRISSSSFRTVRFSELTPSIHPVENIKHMSTEEVANRWYSKEYYDAMKTECSMFGEAEEDSERTILVQREEALQRRRIRQAAADAVLDAQSFHSSSEKSISEAYQRLSVRSAREAHERAMTDVTYVTKEADMSRKNQKSLQSSEIVPSSFKRKPLKKLWKSAARRLATATAA